MSPMNHRLMRPRASGGFSPKNISNLAAWYDASVSSSLFDATSGGSAVAANGAVARWEDQSGNGNHLTQSTANNRPARNVAQFNGKDALLFDGSNDNMQLTTVLAMSGGASIVVVSKRLSDNGSGMYSLTGNISSNHHPFNGGTAYDGFASTTRPASAQSYRSDLYVWSVIAGSNKTIFADNAVLDQYSYTPANQHPSFPAQLIGAGRSDNSFNFSGYICEVLIYTRGITVTENTSLYAYLKTKWGTA